MNIENLVERERIITKFVEFLFFFFIFFISRYANIRIQNFFFSCRNRDDSLSIYRI